MDSDAASVSVPALKKYDVFISFRGIDTRNNIVSHLCDALRRKKVSVYIDDIDLARGVEISSGIQNAIEESKLAVVVFSENYANSIWCLEELVHLLKCKRNLGLLVVPVFHHVDPSWVRKQQGSYGSAFSELEKRYKDELYKLDEWRNALTECASLSGWHSHKLESEPRLIDEIVEYVLTKLGSKSPEDDFSRLVGIDKHIKSFEKLLDLSSRSVRIVGIGGTGKTTLARVMFQRLQHQFGAFCFLENIGEEWVHGKIIFRFFRTLLGERPNTDHGWSMLQKLKRTKVLIVLDDVTHTELQLLKLLDEHRWLYGPGSRIIVTSSDFKLLKNGDAIYEVPELDLDPLSTPVAGRLSKHHDVFLSCCGDAYSFGKHLHVAMWNDRIEVYFSETLEIETITPRLENNAIEESKVAIVVVSKCFISSRGCLDKLVRILKCRERLGMIVVPVFFGVDPSTIREEQKRQAEALAVHEKLSQNKLENAIVEALTTLTCLPACNLNEINSRHDYYELAKYIVIEIKKHLRARSTSDYLQKASERGQLSKDFQVTDKTTCPMMLDVFLSFCSDDPVNNFASHLQAALKRKGITIYSSNGIERGHEVSPKAVNAFQESKLYFVIFSKKYAVSSLCRDELANILQCSEKHGQFVVPIFYDVNPSSVRKSLEQYSAESKEIGPEPATKDMMEDPNKKHESKSVLSAATYLPAWDSNAIEPESKLIEEIVGEIGTKLKKISPNGDFDGLVGIPERLNHVKLMLDSDSPELRIIGIVGMGGTGKTTLAKVVYDQLSFRFEASCFLGNVRELWKNGRKTHLLNKIVSALSVGEDLKKPYKDKLKCKQIFLVLDDVEDKEQFELLVGDRDRFGVGSRIVITSRNNKAVTMTDKVYQMKELSSTEALSIFQRNAFRTDPPTMDFIQLSTKMVSRSLTYNPLALKILSSTLCGKSSVKWNETLKRLHNVSTDDKVQRVLRVSYNLLEKQEKEMFLDIACFFKGVDESFSKRMLDDFQSSRSEAIKDLLDKSLISILDSKVWMHEFLEDLGKKIVLEESAKEPGRRSRLWKAEDVYHVLKKDTGSTTVEGIFLDMSKIQPMKLLPTSLSRMNNLRILKIFSQFGNCTLKIPKGGLTFPDRLRYLYWDAYPYKSLRGFIGTNLVELRMQFSKAEGLWNEAQGLENLRVIDLSYSCKLIEIPNIAKAPNVETVSLRGCARLREVPLYFASLEKLISLDLEDCSSLKKVSSLPMNIVHLNLSRCNKLKYLPSYVSELKFLRRLDLFGCLSLEKTPNNLCSSQEI